MRIRDQIKGLFKTKKKEVGAEYVEIPLYYTDKETGLPLEPREVKAYMYVLSCPVCGMAVKRSDTYCAECGNKVAM